MKNILIVLVLSFLILSACQNTGTVEQNQDVSDSMLLSDFIIGQWNSAIQVSDIHGSYTKTYHVEFISTDKLSLQMSSPYNGINAKFDYEFINPSTILVENKRAQGGTWDISRDKENLLICIWSDSNNCMVFTRDN